MTSTRTGRDRGPALQRLGRTNRIQPSAQDVYDPSPMPCSDRSLRQPCCTSGFVPTILGPSGNAHCVLRSERLLGVVSQGVKEGQGDVWRRGVSVEADEG